jgi:subtilase family serine protease
VTANSDRTFTATMLVKNTGTTPVSAAQTQVLDGRKQVALTPATDFAAGEARTLTVSWKASGAKSHTITAVTDPQNAVAEDDESDNKLVDTITR